MMKQGKNVHQNQADALEAYWKSQDEKIKRLESFVELGGSISTEFNQMMEEFQQTGMRAYEQLMHGQKMLLAHLNNTETMVSVASAPLSQSVVSKKEVINPWANEVIDSIDLTDPKTIKRREVQITPCEDTTRGKSALPKSGIILFLGEEDAYGKKLKNYLQEHGLLVKHIQNFLEEEEAKSLIAETIKEDEITGLVVLGNKYYNTKERECYYDYIMTVVHIIKHFVIYIRTQKSDRQWLFLFHTFLDGKLGMTGKSEYFHYGTFNGMAKCIPIELRDLVYVKEIDFEPTIKAETMIQYLDEELCFHENFQEVGRTMDGVRHRLTSVLTKSEVIENRCPLQEEDILLVSGGARGVTSSCILELAKRVKCTYVLLGRAQILEENNDDEETAKVTELKDMKNLIAKRFKAKGQKGAFAAIDKKARAILAQREMLRTIEGIKATGNRVFYYSCNVIDQESMKETLARIQKEVGKITGVIHGAGIVADSKIWNKDMKSFQRVFDTKYKGLNNIMDYVDKETLKVLVMFSSLSGYFGNDGQLDYVSANEYMDKYAYYIRDRYPNCRAVAINWGAWRGGMMYLDDLYITTLTAKGYILIPLEVGANYFVNDFLMGLPSTQILINNTGNPPV